jgi:triacylglycerol lipase
MIDRDLIQDRGFNQLNTGKFVKVPILLGNVFDEGTLFTLKGINNDTQFLAFLKANTADNSSATSLLGFYPDIPAIGIPATFAGRPDTTLGQQFKRAASFEGDLIYHTPRRLTAAAWAANNLTSFSYRFNVLEAGISSASGSEHGADNPFVFYNTDGSGYPLLGLTPPFQGKPKSYFDLAIQATRMWSSFIADLDPNTFGGELLQHMEYFMLIIQTFSFLLYISTDL